MIRQLAAWEFYSALSAFKKTRRWDRALSLQRKIARYKMKARTDIMLHPMGLQVHPFAPLDPPLYVDTS